MEKIEKFVACDGTEFYTEEECLNYENRFYSKRENDIVQFLENFLMEITTTGEAIVIINGVREKITEDNAFRELVYIYNECRPLKIEKRAEWLTQQFAKGNLPYFNKKVNSN